MSLGSNATAGETAVGTMGDGVEHKLCPRDMLTISIIWPGERTNIVRPLITLKQPHATVYDHSKLQKLLAFHQRQETGSLYYLDNAL